MTATESRSAVAPTRQSRRASRRSGSASRVLSAAAGLLLVGGAMAMQTLDLSDGELSAPLTYTGAKGETVDARRYTVRLDSFAAAKSIQDDDGTIGTDNLFLIVNASAKSSLKPYHLGHPVLVTADDKKFDATDRVDTTDTLANTWVQPDIWVSGRFFFEVPASALPGARVVFRLPPQAGLQEPYQPEVEVDLGLDEEAARKLAASPQDVYSTVKK
ncbi:hypothetical protein ETD86_51460 [Nonomuraea turkmeniaca]|uniref:DUF4352 domain-containing protein n=1 Tax=Nonomuraea turkmeniaca TaxID=103838 RepID=A0A5S4EVM1_9ACTN|nr:hypothetical protein [Nonomuraea turkmeniaca]TMR07584.1 hypothetical protein ETD86_51460 [Nonomuraea turkmeniaca]